MTQYLLSIYQPEGPAPVPQVMDRVGRELHALNEELKAAGAWVFTGGLHEPSTATVVGLRGGGVEQSGSVHGGHPPGTAARRLDAPNAYPRILIVLAVS